MIPYFCVCKSSQISSVYTPITTFFLCADLDSRAGRTPMKFAEVCGAAYILAFLIYAALRGHGMAVGMAKG